MKTLYLVLATIFIATPLVAQVGINNTDPKATLDISSSNVATPANTDGLLIPRIDEFPASPPGADQDGMMVFVTGAGTTSKGFYYWNQNTTSWTSVSGAADVDWLNVSGNTPTTISEDIYTEGNIGIGIIPSGNKITVLDNDTSNINGMSLVRSIASNSPGGGLRGISSSGIMSGSNPRAYTGVYSILTGSSGGLTNSYEATMNSLIANGSVSLYKGNFSNISGSGNMYGLNISFGNITNTGTKYGNYISFSNTQAGLHYGFYSNVQSAAGYAAYFLGRTSLGTALSNRYLMPATDGTSGQVMTTDGSGNITFQDATGGDADFYETGTTNVPDNINDNVYTLGSLNVGSSTNTTDRLYVANPVDEANSGIRLVSTGDDSGSIAYGMTNQSSVGDVLRFSNYYNTIAGTSNTTLRMIENQFSNTGTGTKTAIYNEFNFNAQEGGKIGMTNRFEGGDTFATGIINEAPGAWSVNSTLTGVQNSLDAGGNGVRYGTRNSINGLGSGTKYGTHNSIGSTAGGTHYGVYSDVRKSNSYAGFFIGRTSFGTDAVLNRYLLPATDGTAGQVMTTDGAGQLSFSTPTIGVEKIDDLLDGKSDNDGSDDGSSIFLGVNAGAADDSSSNANIGIGYTALEDNTTGSLNTAIGWGSLRDNTGSSNTAFGYLSASGNTTGDFNTAIGRNSLLSNSIGDNNTALGYYAGFSNTGSGNVFLGANSGLNQGATDNKLYIENTDADANSALIYGDFGTDSSTTGNILRTNSEFQIGNPSTTGYAFPTADGTAGQILTTDGFGNITFASPSNADADWYEVATTSSPDDINDNIYTQGKVGIGDTSPDFALDIEQTTSDLNGVNIDYTYTGSSAPAKALKIYAQGTGAGSNVYGAYIQAALSPNSGETTAVYAFNSATGSSNRGLYALAGGAGNTNMGVRGYADDATTNYGGYFTAATGGGGATTNYGIYAAGLGATTNWAGYFGATGQADSGNVYIQDALHADGTFQYSDGSEVNGYVLTTDASGNASWTSPTTGAEKIDDLTDGKSDNDGSQDGSSIFLGINAGTADNSTDNQNIGIGYDALQANTNGERNVALGYTTLFNNISGVSNTAIGYSAMYANTSGRDNTAIGVSALVFNSTGNHNIAIGTTALWRNTAGSNNIGIGEAALFDHTIGEDNIALGYRSLYNITTGNENVALGAEAGLTNITGIGNVYLGNDAGRSHVGSNTLWIENTSTDANNALIYGEFDNDILRTNGEFQIGNPTGTGYSFPTTDGINGQVLTTNGAGAISFQTIVGDGDTQNTLDQAYDEGGAGAGSTITATDGAVTIEGQDGFTVTGTLNSGDFIAVTGAGTRMFFNPNKASFRAGTVDGAQWDNVNLGSNSVAFGSNNIASGGASTSLGTGNTSSGTASVALGSGNTTSGGNSVALNRNNTASGLNSFAQGFGNTSSASSSTAMGIQNTAPSWAEMVVGSFATTYAANSTVGLDINDRVFTVGNGVSTAARSNALTIYKNGEVNINDAYSLPTSDGVNGQVMTTDGSGNVTFQNATVNTDNQNIESLSLNSTTNVLTVGIENGASDTVDLSSLNPPKALARITLSANQVETGAGITKVNFDTEDFDIGGNFNLTNDEFEVPADGVYRVHTQISMNSTTSTGAFDVRIRVDGNQVRRAAFDHPGSGSVIRQVTSLLELTAGQVIDIAFLRAAAITVNSNDALSYFEIEQL